MKRKIFTGTWAFLSLLAQQALAQNSLYVGAGTQLHITQNTTVAIDSLVLIPSVPYTITGQNSVMRSAITQHTASNSHINRVYQWQANLPAFTGTVQFYYRDSELNSLPENGLTLNVHNGNAWYAIPPLSRDATANLVTTTLTGISLSELTLASIGAPLPMKWIHAEANHVNGRNVIKWITADEWDCKDYIVEKSTNGSNWQPIAAAIPARNTAGPNNYQLTDPSVPASVTWYRIRQTDIDGRISYSVILIVQTGRGIIVQLYPNPAGQQFTISAGQSLRGIQIYNTAGSMVYIKNISGMAYHTINSSRFAAGNYYAVIQLEDGSVAKEYFIKQ